MPTKPATPPALSEAGKAAIAKLADSATARGEVPGVVTMIVGREGVLYQGAAGMQDAGRCVAMKTNAIFRIASMTKPITSVATMMVVESGELKLDDPVEKFLPAFKDRQVITGFNPRNGSYGTRRARRPVTIRHLLANTSGIGYAFTDPTLERIIRGTSITEPELPLLHDPGAKWTYSPATRVLGWVIEKISGQRIDAFQRTQILEPLDMRETWYAVPARKVPRVVTFHQRTKGKLIEEPNAPRQDTPVRGDGGLFSTAADYAQFVRMLLNGGSLEGVKILSPQTVKQMGRNAIGALTIQTQPDAIPGRTRPFPIGAGLDKFGLGFQITAADPKVARYRSPGSLAWGGIYNTHFWIDPKRQVGGIVLMQVLPFYDRACMRVVRGIEALVYRDLG
jgi:CubicO group peptidase (beta-lactamase class C family)